MRSGLAESDPAGARCISSEMPVIIATVLRPQGTNGVQSHLGEFTRYLDAHRLPMEVITAFTSAGLLRFAAFGVRRLLEPVSGGAALMWYTGSHRYFLERALRRRLATLGPAIVYCQCPVSALAALRARRLPEHRVVLAVHFLVSQADEWVSKHKIVQDGTAFRRIRRLERTVLSEVDGVVFVSEAARSGLWLGEPADIPTATIPNFVTLPELLEREPPRADLVSIGSLEPHKNHAFLLDVLAAAKRRGYRFTLDIIGGGPGRRVLLNQSLALGIDDQVRLLGTVPQAARLLPGYRVYVHASTRESLGIAIIEAMAAGIPVVAAPVGGIPQLFNEPTEGAFWMLDDPSEAASLLIRVLSDEPTRARMGAAARRRARAHFETEAVGTSLRRFLVEQCGVSEPCGNGRRASPAAPRDSTAPLPKRRTLDARPA